MAIRPGGSGDVTGTPRILWTYAKGTAYVPSPILYGDYVYLVTDKGLVTCLDARTGEVKYEGAPPPDAGDRSRPRRWPSTARSCSSARTATRT